MTPEVRVALEAGRAAVRRIHAAGDRAARVEHKGAVDLVTELDLACERAIREVLARHTPDVPVLGEEEGGAAGARTRWVVDPIDGTTNFVHGFPYYATSIALTVDEEPVAACVIDAFRDLEYTAARGRGARCGDAALRVSDCRDLGLALVGTGFPYDRRDRAAFYLERIRRVLERAQDVRRAGAASLDLAQVAHGRLDAFWEFHLKPWDVAAAALLITEAGGRITDHALAPLRGTDLHPLATNGWLHDALASLLADA